MNRTFVGIEIPPGIRDRLAMLRANLPGARWVDPDDYHLTLRFLGHCDGPTLGNAIGNLDRISPKPFTLQIGEPGVFGHDSPRAIWMGISNNPELSVLQQQVDHAVCSAGLPGDHRRFTPHITLARISRGHARHRKSGSVASALAAIGNPRVEPFTVNRFVLYSSGRSRGGGPYAIDETFPFATVSDIETNNKGSTQIDPDTD